MPTPQSFVDYRIVRHEHLNQYGCLFGGFLLQIIDELAFVAAVRTFPGHNFLTRALTDVVFHAPARLGDILETSAQVVEVGKTSLRVKVQVFVGQPECCCRHKTFDGTVVLVSVDQQGKASAIVRENAVGEWV